METFERSNQFEAQRESAGDEIDLRHLFQLVKDRIWWLVLATFLFGAAASLVSSLLTPIYKTSATVLINQSKNGASATYNDILTSERIARTYAELMTSQPILAQVGVRLGLDSETFEETITSIDVSAVRNTQLMLITIEDDSPELAANVANILPAVFIADNIERQSKRFASSKQSMTAQLAVLDSDIVAAQSELDGKLGAEVFDQNEVNRLQNTINQYRASYTSLLQSFEAVRLTEAQSSDTIMVVERAQVPKAPVRPRILLNTLLAAMFWLVLAFFVVLLSDVLDDTVKTP